jgi:hypothetical protein
MAYIGNPPISGNFQVCDAISVVNGQAAYTMQVSSANVSPESANHMLVSLNGVLQKPNSSFTISSSTITFASNLATGDVIDFILLLGNVNDIGTPSDSTVTNAKTNFTTTSSAAGLQIKGDGTTAGALQLNCEQNSHGIKLQSPAHSSSQSYTLKFPTGNVTADRFLKVASVSGSGTTGIGQLSFAEAGGGAFTLLQSTTASSASLVAFNSLITSTYRDYRIICSQIDGSEDADINMQISDDNGSSYQTSGNYRYKNYGYTNGGANGSGANGHTAANFLPATAEFSEAGQSVSLIIDIFNPLSTSHYFTWAVRGHYNEPSSPTRQGGFYGGGAWINVYNTAYNALKIYPTSGTFSGEISLYGRKV